MGQSEELISCDKCTAEFFDKPMVSSNCSMSHPVWSSNMFTSCPWSNFPWNCTPMGPSQSNAVVVVDATSILNNQTSLHPPHPPKKKRERERDKHKPHARWCMHLNWTVLLWQAGINFLFLYRTGHSFCLSSTTVQKLKQCARLVWTLRPSKQEK